MLESIHNFSKLPLHFVSLKNTQGKSNLNSLTINLTAVLFLTLFLSNFPLLAGSEDGALSCMATSGSFPFSLMNHNKMQIHQKTKSKAGPELWQCLMVLYDLCFIIHCGMPKKGWSKNGEENRHRQVFELSNQTNMFCMFPTLLQNQSKVRQA